MCFSLLVTLLLHVRRTAIFALWVPLLGGAVTACSRDVERSLSPAPGLQRNPVTIVESERLTSIETDTLNDNGKPTRVLCATCHNMVNIGEVTQSMSDLKEFHTGLSFNHGDMACRNCHEPGKPLKLHLATGDEVPLEQAMELCSQCHGLQRRSYDHGAHGGMIGHWDLSRGPRLRNNCVDCHDPHTPQISQVLPARRPIDRGVLNSGGKH